ncbi:MAG: LysR family transcriptional regulator [Pseudomonadota bacterium]
MDVKVSSLRAFALVVEHGNISDAADALGRTPAAVSLTLKQLEGTFGQALFAGERKSTLTPFGEFVHAQALRQVGQFDETLRSIERFARGETGNLSIASVPSFATRFLPDLIREYCEHFPDVTLELHEMDSIGVREALNAGEIDVGFLSDSRVDAGGQCLLQDALGVVCHREHPLAKRNQPVDWQALDGTNLIRNRIAQMIPDAAFKAILERASLHVHNTASLLALAANNVGVTVLPAMAVPDDDPRLVFLPLQPPRHSRYIHMLTSSGATTNPVLREWCEWIVKRFD